MGDSSLTTPGLDAVPGSNQTAFPLPGSNQTAVPLDGDIHFSTLIYLAVVTISGAVSNTVALVYIVRDVRRAVFPAIILLLVLCCADLAAIAVTFLRIMLRYFLLELTYGACASLTVTNLFFFLYAGILNAMMAIDRVMALGMPFYYKSRVDVNTWKTGCLVSALGSAAFTLLPIMGLGKVMVTVEENGQTRVMCTSFTYQEEAQYRVYGYLYVVVGFVITLTIAIGNIFVIRCVLMLRKKIVNMAPLNTSTSSSADSTTATSNSTSFEVAFAKLMGCLAAVHVITGTPFYVSRK